MKNNPNFSERLKELMYDCGDIKSERLGAEIGVSGQSVRGWCEGTQSISLSHLLKLADYFNCSLEFLLARSDIECDYTPRGHEGEGRHPLSNGQGIQDQGFLLHRVEQRRRSECGFGDGGRRLSQRLDRLSGGPRSLNLIKNIPEKCFCQA